MTYDRKLFQACANHLESLSCALPVMVGPDDLSDAVLDVLHRLGAATAMNITLEEIKRRNNSDQPTRHVHEEPDAHP